MRILALLLMTLLSTPLFAAVSAQVDKNPLLAGESLTLTIRSESSKDEPDLTLLDQDFHVLARRSSSQIRMSNGHTTRTHEWLVQLRPKRIGTLRIPPIPIGSERTDAIEITVKKPDVAQGELPESYIEFEADKDSAWLREQIIVTARLYVRGDLLSGSFSEPSSPSAVIEQLGEQRESQALRGSQRYRVIERRYAVFAEQSGTLELNGPVFSGEVADSTRRSQGLFGFGTPSRSLYAAADPIRIDIKSPPANVSPWLPASDVQLSQTLSPAQGPWKSGQPLTRTITLTVAGQLHTQLPDFEPQLPPNSQSFTEPPQEKTQSDGMQLIATRSYSTAIIPGPGERLILPAVEVQWWDTQSNTLRSATLAQRELELEALPAAPVATPGTTAQTPPAPADATAPPTVIAERSSGAVDWRWQVAAVTCAAGWLGTVLAWLWQTRRRERVTRTPRDDADKRTTVQSLKSGDAKTCRQALLQWARQRTGRTMRLEQLQQLSNDPELAAALAALDAAVYGGGNDFAREPLIRLVRNHTPAKPRSSSAESLPSLYPE